MKQRRKRRLPERSLRANGLDLHREVQIWAAPCLWQTGTCSLVVESFVLFFPQNVSITLRLGFEGQCEALVFESNF